MSCVLVPRDLCVGLRSASRLEHKYLVEVILVKYKGIGDNCSEESRKCLSALVPQIFIILTDFPELEGPLLFISTRAKKDFTRFLQ